MATTGSQDLRSDNADSTLATSVKSLQTQQKTGSKSLPPVSKEEYDVSHKNRGLALIFSHKFYKNDKIKTRVGVEKDEESLLGTLTKLGFHVEINRNYTKANVMERLNSAALEDHSDRDCLVVVVMSHGHNDKICAYDDLYGTKNLWKAFTDSDNKTLDRKPKLFFIQACRGSDVDSGITVTSQPVTAMDSAPIKPTFSVPSDPDILIHNSTFQDHLAWRNDDGSWFIQELCSELTRNGGTKSLLQMLTAVNHHVATGYESKVSNNEEKNKKKQMPHIVSTLTHELYFRPKAL